MVGIINKILDNDSDVNTSGINISIGSSPYGYYHSSTEYDNDATFNVAFGIVLAR